MLPRSQLVLLGSLAAILAISLGSSHIDESYLRIAMLAGVNIILAVSLNLINGYTGQFSLGHAGFMSVGAYTSAAITLYLGPAWLGVTGANAAGTGMLFLVSLLAGGVLAAVAGFIVGAPSLRLRGDYLAIVTLGFGEIIRVIFTNVKSLGGGLGLNGIPPYTNFFWTYGFAALTVYAVVAMVHSTYGRGFLAVHDDEVAAEAMGINTTRYKITAFVTGSFFAGIAGGIFAHLNHSIHPSGFDFIKSIEIVVMVILGGMGNTTGVVLAAILLTVLPEFLRSIDEYRMVIYSLLLIVLMLTRPQGLFTFRKGVKVGG
jgi:branched-chain amino acid transport system permease protein